MPPRLIKTITIARPNEHWETKTTAGITDSSRAASLETAELSPARTGPSLEPPSATSPRATTKAEAVVSQDGDDAVIRLRIPRTLMPESSAMPTPMQRISAIKGRPISHTRAPAVTNPAKKFYGVVPNTHSRRAEPAINGFQTHVQTAGPSFTAGAVQSETTLPQYVNDRLPEFPTWLAILMLCFLVVSFVAAILLYFVNFPSARRWFRWRRRSYQRVREEDFELNEYPEGDLPLREYAAFSSSADTPILTLRERRSAQDLHVDIGAGLGITVNGETSAELRKRRSFDDRPNAENPSLRSPAPPSYHNAATAPLPSPRAFLSSRISRARPRAPDLEDGLLDPTQHRESNSPSPPSSTSSSRSSSRLDLLKDSVESGLGYLAKKMHDHVHDKQPEEGLLLPVRAEEREKLRWSNGKLKKLY